MRAMGIAVFVVVIDQLTKWIVQDFFHLGMSIPVWKGVFYLTYVQNPGAAFGILAHQHIFFLLATAALFAVFFYFLPYIREQGRCMQVGVALLLGGAVGNFIDRVRFGYVIDYFDFRIWPVFNLADIAICVGVGLMVYAILFHMKGVE